MTNRKGFTLLELIMVIAIITILVSIAGFSGFDWLMRSKVEGQTKALYSDLMMARVSAMQRNRFFFVNLAADKYTIYEDTYPAPNGDEEQDFAHDRLVARKDTAFALNSGVTTSLKFTGGGLLDPSGTSATIRVVSNANSAFDCVVVNITKIHMGKWNGTTCVFQ